MPGRNIVKYYAPQSYYHVYNRGVAKLPIFLDEYDKRQFLKIVGRHLDPADMSTKEDGVPYRKFNDQLELLCYCLTRNHFHLLFYQLSDDRALTEFMRAVVTAYSMYFNRRYKRVGPVFQGRFKAVHITEEAHLIHISRYIHLNPRHYKTYRYSSLQQYYGQPGVVWCRPERILDLFEGEDYLQFVEDYEGMRGELDAIKRDLANY